MDKRPSANSRIKWEGSKGTGKVIRGIVECRLLLNVLFSSCAGVLLLRRLPFPEEHALLQLVDCPGVTYSMRAASFCTCRSLLRDSGLLRNNGVN